MHACAGGSVTAGPPPPGRERSLGARIAAIVVLACATSLGCRLLAPSLDDLPGPAGELPAGRPVEPFRIFDEVYYVGLDWVSCYLIVTSDGLVLIDSLYGEHVETLLRSIEALGFRPADLRYVLVTHGHFDHAGGARELQRRYGARIAMTAEDWELAQSPPDDPRFAFDPPEEDIVLGSGEAIQLGETEIRFHRTPGHTLGVLSMELLVHDGGRPHRAFVFGGVGLNFRGVERTESYLASVRAVRALAGTDPPIEVNLANHPSMNALFERAGRLRERAAADPHPLVDAPAFLLWLDELERSAEAKLTRERDRSPP